MGLGTAGRPALVDLEGYSAHYLHKLRVSPISKPPKNIGACRVIGALGRSAYALERIIGLNKVFSLRVDKCFGV